MPAPLVALALAGTAMSVPFFIDDSLGLLDQVGFDATGRKKRAQKLINQQASLAERSGLGIGAEQAKQDALSDLLGSIPQETGKAQGLSPSDEMFLSQLVQQHRDRVAEVAAPTMPSYAELIARMGFGG